MSLVNGTRLWIVVLAVSTCAPAWGSQPGQASGTPPQASAAANAELANAKVATRTEDLIFMVLHFPP